jgi:hypothetical protein
MTTTQSRAPKFSTAALEVLEETGTDWATDLASLRDGSKTADSLLAECLEGADEAHATAWHEYVAELDTLV